MSMVRYTSRTFARELILLALAIGWWLPFYLLAVTALKPPSEVYTSPLSPPHVLALSNFATAWKGTGSGSGGLGSALINSFIITVGTVAALIIFGSLASYAIARRGGRMGNILYGLFLVGLVLPFQLGVLPAYVVSRDFGLTGTLPGTVLVYTALFMPLTVFLYSGFIRVLPRDYEEAAYVDGAGFASAFVRVVFPLLTPITGTVAILAGLLVWNDFFLQLVFLGGTDTVTVPVAIYSFVGQYVSQWNVVFAAVAISIAPILCFYVVAQRQLIRGFTSGLKG